ncbi:hypothetical protein VFPPC_11752 [Pochonia chlamydosporia 170]|uniref:Uncharacterized protein n=1 Tax=Pochonia chlamydosporia 170 TaxID=1380566 RepID=A0A179EXT7_METCM|nr:hypothetical protein VFPPC_11752 [Pochonia chlamydosporia 170]OAQ58005.1 hypothetical protein VFPPC_11752 [Pochonia chlamydosporia 170]
MASSIPLPRACYDEYCATITKDTIRTTRTVSLADGGVWEYDDTYLEKSEAEIIMALLPSLEVFLLDIDNFGEKTVARLLDNQSGLGWGCLPILPRMKRLDIRSQDNDWTIHYTNSVAQALIKCAPNIETLSLYNIDMRSGLINSIPSLDLACDGAARERIDNAKTPISWLRNLRTIDLVDCCLENDELMWLQNMTSDCGGLERFSLKKKYCGQGLGPELWPCKVLDAISGASKSLKELNLHIKGTLYTQDRNAAEHVCGRNQLARLTRLETLEIHEDAFCRGHSMAYEEEDISDSTIDDWSCLTRIVPNSVKNLVIWADKYMPSLKDLMHFAEHVLAGHFPSLRHTHVVFSDYHSIPQDKSAETITVSVNNDDHCEIIGQSGKQ